jgi:hypothetical protein
MDEDGDFDTQDRGMDDRIGVLEDGARFRAGDSVSVCRPGATLTVALVRDRADMERVFDLRRDTYRGQSEYLLHARVLDAGAALRRHPADDGLDEDSYVFAAFVREDGAREERCVAACRFTPCPGGRWEAADQHALPGELLAECERLVQVSRVVVAEPERRHRITEVMIWFACNWVARQTPMHSYFALCLPPLVRYYRHFGASVVPGPDLGLAGRGSNRYRFIAGGLAQTATATRRHLEQAGDDRWTLPTEVFGTVVS